MTPFHSYPSGVTADVSKRHEYLRWAEEKGRYIVEDDFDSEFFIPGNPIESLYALGGGRSVIYINTFSKSLSPAMRIGYMILPEELLSTYDAHVGMFSCSVPVMDQYVLAEFIASGPGVLSAMAITSIYSSCSIHFLRSTSSLSITAIIAYPPPKVNSPILKKFINSKSADFNFFIFNIIALRKLFCKRLSI